MVREIPVDKTSTQFVPDTDFLYIWANLNLLRDGWKDIKKRDSKTFVLSTIFRVRGNGISGYWSDFVTPEGALEGKDLESNGIVELCIRKIRNINVIPKLDVAHSPIMGDFARCYAHCEIIDSFEPRYKRLHIREELSDIAEWVIPIF